MLPYSYIAILSDTVCLKDVWQRCWSSLPKPFTNELWPGSAHSVPLTTPLQPSLRSICSVPQCECDSFFHQLFLSSNLGPKRNQTDYSLLWRLKLCSLTKRHTLNVMTKRGHEGLMWLERDITDKSVQVPDNISRITDLTPMHFVLI